MSEIHIVTVQVPPASEAVSFTSISFWEQVGSRAPFVLF